MFDALDGEKKIGLEATGHYGQNLKLFLENNSFSFIEFNPLLINRFVCGKSLRKTKTDSIDALMVAQYLMTVEYKPYPSSLLHVRKAKVTNKISGQPDSAAEQAVGGVNKHP